MRSIAAALVVALTLVAGAGVTGATPADDAAIVRDRATAWLAPQVTDGALISPYTALPDPSMTAQAALALAGAGAEPATVAAMIAWLADNVEDYVAPGGAADSPGALAWLILDAVAVGADPTSFGGVDLVARLEATEEPDGLFGSDPPTYDGVFRQGLSLIALTAAGVPAPDGVAWLVDQQCDDGGFVAFRIDTSVPCPSVDPLTFAGEDTNSTALAAMALDLAGADAPADAAMAWLESVRTPAGGFPYLGDPTLAQDANSTGLVALAFRTVEGTVDAGSVAAMGALQVPETGDAADRGGIAFQAADPLFPDLMATTQALLGLAGQALPFTPVEPEQPEVTDPPVTTPPTSTPDGSVPAPDQTPDTTPEETPVGHRPVGDGGPGGVHVPSATPAVPVGATPTYAG